MTRAFWRFSLAGLVLPLGLCPMAFSQAAPAKGSNVPEFEVSSVRVQKWGRGGFEHQDAGRIEYHYINLARLANLAFDIAWESLIQWPSSLGYSQQDTFYDVQATFPVGTSAADRRLMLQSLLRDRFGFRYHYEDRSVPYYALVVAPGGLKVQKAPPSDAITNSRRGVKQSQTAFTLDGDVPLLSAVEEFQLYLDFPIADETNLGGAYTIHLTVPRGESNLPAQAPNPHTLSPSDKAEMIGFDTATFSSALEHQLGVKLEKRTKSAKVLVVDSANTAPTSN
jgi:uncharacterized protein (TIGR03435 family)